MLGQESEIQGLLPGQLGVALEENSVEYIFYANESAVQEHAEMLEEEVLFDAQNNDESSNKTEQVESGFVNDTDADTFILSEKSENSDVWELDETLIFGDGMCECPQCVWSGEWSNCESTESDVNNSFIDDQVPHEAFDFYF